MTRPLVPPGAGIAVVSPAAPAAHTMPLRLELGLRWLADAGYRPRLMPSAAGADPHPEPAERVADLHAAFADPDTRLVLGAIGGNSAVTLLPLLDPGIAREHRAATQGGSDLTSLLWFLHHHAGTPAIYGPMAAMGLAEQPAVLDVTARGIAGAWSGQPYECRPGEFWTEERLRIDAGREAAPHTQHRAASGAGGWRAPRGGGRARGRLLAGCLEALAWWVRGTPSWDLLTRSDDVVLALDIALPGSRWSASGLGGPDGVDTMLRVLAAAGAFRHVTGLVVGRPRGYLQTERAELDAALRRVVPEHIVVLTEFDLGHTQPEWALPLGVECELDADAQVLRVGAATGTGDRSADTA